MCDLGCGAGASLLLLAARVSPLALSGVEYCPEDAAMARQNLAENGLEGAICTGDLCAVCKTLPAGGFSLAISNPPYFKAGSGGAAGPPGWRGTAPWRTGAPPPGGSLKNGDASPSFTGRSVCAISLPPSAPPGWSPSGSGCSSTGRIARPPPSCWRRCGRAGRGWRFCPHYCQTGGNIHGRNAVSGTHPHRQPGGHLPAHRGHPGGGGFYCRGGYPGDPQAA
ncbi:MAG: methyltransferase [Flavonifractor plautii]